MTHSVSLKMIEDGKVSIDTSIASIEDIGDEETKREADEKDKLVDNIIQWTIEPLNIGWIGYSMLKA